MAAIITSNKTGIKFLLRALRSRNYRLFFVGQGMSLIGSWMQIIAVSWLAYRLTGSAFMLGLVGFLGQIPTFLFAPVAGVLADHRDRRNILIITQILAMAQAFVLGILTITHTVEVWHLISLTVFIGLVNAFDMPVRQAFVADLIDRREDLGNAIALNSMIFNGARLIGPALAGILIAAAGEGPCFLINSMSFLAVIIALSAMRIKIYKIQKKRPAVLKGIKEGLGYAFNNKVIRHLLILVTLISVMGMSYAVLMPIFAKEFLGGSAHTLGFLMGATGVGALAGAVYLASRKSIYGLERAIPAATIIFSLGLIAFSFSRILWLSLALMVCVGFGLIVQMASSNTVLQSITEDDKRGRVMSFYVMAFMGMAPFGSLLAGALASRIGAPKTVLISGITCMAGSLFFTFKMPIDIMITKPIKDKI